MVFNQEFFKNGIMIGLVILAVAFMLNSKMRINNNSILSLALIVAAVMCLVSNKRKNMTSEACFLVSIYLLSTLLSKFKGIIENFSTGTQTVLASEEYEPDVKVTVSGTAVDTNVFSSDTTTTNKYKITSIDNLLNLLNGDETKAFRETNIIDKSIQLKLGGQDINSYLNFTITTISGDQPAKIIDSFTEKSPEPITPITDLELEPTDVGGSPKIVLEMIDNTSSPAPIPGPFPGPIKRSTTPGALTGQLTILLSCSWSVG